MKATWYYIEYLYQNLRTQHQKMKHNLENKTQDRKD
jgi:hypothetical protein